MARDPARIDDVLQLLGRIWRQHPDQRLGQQRCVAVVKGLEAADENRHVVLLRCH